MRVIKNKRLSLDISQAAIDKQSLISAVMSIPLDPSKLLKGEVLLESIMPNVLPDLIANQEYFTQELEEETVEHLRAYIAEKLGLVNQTATDYHLLEWLQESDNALLGKLNAILVPVPLPNGDTGQAGKIWYEKT